MAELRQRAVQPEENLLGEIGNGIGASEHARQGAEDHPLVLADDVGEVLGHRDLGA
jgi:hypothetical protein